MQRDHSWLASATPEQVNTARRAGELDTLIGRHVPDLDTNGHLTEQQVNILFAHGRYTDINHARREGRLDALLDGRHRNGDDNGTQHP